jgi:N-acetyl sugar amidotransferase
MPEVSMDSVRSQSRDYQACRRCIMDRVSDPTITFDTTGLCSHCARYDRLASARLLRGEAAREALTRLVGKIKQAGRGREYDCIVGVSGGVDSTYVAYLVKSMGLRPLALHLDNGWDSELAVSNIEKAMRQLGIDLFSYVIDWEEFRDLQLSFLKASTPDGEIPTDHAISAVLWTQAAARGIKYVISGMNFATEAVSVPDWSYGHSDWRYIKAVHKRFGTGSLRTYPRFSLTDLIRINVLSRVRMVSVLNYVDYRKADAMRLLQEELGWVYYGGKHYESVYTRFWQGYVLPRKFGIDKRYGHFSDLINSGQMTRAEAVEAIKSEPYPPALAEQDLKYVVKKLRLTAAQFDALMALPPRTFRDYPNNFARVERLRRLANFLRARGWYAR